MVAGADGAISLQAGLFPVVGTRGHAAAASFLQCLNWVQITGELKRFRGLKIRCRRLSLAMVLGCFPNWRAMVVLDCRFSMPD